MSRNSSSVKQDSHHSSKASSKNNSFHEIESNSPHDSANSHNSRLQKRKKVTIKFKALSSSICSSQHGKDDNSTDSYPKEIPNEKVPSSPSNPEEHESSVHVFCSPTNEIKPVIQGVITVEKYAKSESKSGSQMDLNESHPTPHSSKSPKATPTSPQILTKEIIVTDKYGNQRLVTKKYMKVKKSQLTPKQIEREADFEEVKPKKIPSKNANETPKLLISPGASNRAKLEEINEHKGERRRVRKRKDYVEPTDFDRHNDNSDDYIEIQVIPEDDDFEDHYPRKKSKHKHNSHRAHKSHSNEHQKRKASSHKKRVRHSERRNRNYFSDYYSDYYHSGEEETPHKEEEPTPRQLPTPSYNTQGTQKTYTEQKSIQTEPKIIQRSCDISQDDDVSVNHIPISSSDEEEKYRDISIDATNHISSQNKHVSSSSQASSIVKRIDTESSISRTDKSVEFNGKMTQTSSISSEAPLYLPSNDDRKKKSSSSRKLDKLSELSNMSTSSHRKKNSSFIEEQSKHLSQAEKDIQQSCSSIQSSKQSELQVSDDDNNILNQVSESATSSCVDISPLNKKSVVSEASSQSEVTHKLALISISSDSNDDDDIKLSEDEDEKPPSLSTKSSSSRKQYSLENVSAKSSKKAPSTINEEPSHKSSIYQLSGHQSSSHQSSIHQPSEHQSSAHQSSLNQPSAHQSSVHKSSLHQQSSAQSSKINNSFQARDISNISSASKSSKHDYKEASSISGFNSDIIELSEKSSKSSKKSSIIEQNSQKELSNLQEEIYKLEEEEDEAESEFTPARSEHSTHLEQSSHASSKVNSNLNLSNFSTSAKSSHMSSKHSVLSISDKNSAINLSNIRESDVAEFIPENESLKKSSDASSPINNDFSEAFANASDNSVNIGDKFIKRGLNSDSLIDSNRTASSHSNQVQEEEEDKSSSFASAPSKPQSVAQSTPRSTRSPRSPRSLRNRRFIDPKEKFYTIDLSIVETVISLVDDNLSQEEEQMNEQPSLLNTTMFIQLNFQDQETFIRTKNMVGESIDNQTNLQTKWHSNLSVTGFQNSTLVFTLCRSEYSGFKVVATKAIPLKEFEKNPDTWFEFDDITDDDHLSGSNEEIQSIGKLHLTAKIQSGIVLDPGQIDKQPELIVSLQPVELQTTKLINLKPMDIESSSVETASSNLSDLDLDAMKQKLHRRYKDLRNQFSINDSSLSSISEIPSSSRPKRNSNASENSAVDNNSSSSMKRRRVKKKDQEEKKDSTIQPNPEEKQSQQDPSLIEFNEFSSNLSNNFTFNNSQLPSEINPNNTKPSEQNIKQNNSDHHSYSSGDSQRFKSEDDFSEITNGKSSSKGPSIQPLVVPKSQVSPRQEPNDSLLEKANNFNFNDNSASNLGSQELPSLPNYNISSDSDA